MDKDTAGHRSYYVKPPDGPASNSNKNDCNSPKLQGFVELPLQKHRTHYFIVGKGHSNQILKSRSIDENINLNPRLPNVRLG